MSKVCEVDGAFHVSVKELNHAEKPGRAVYSVSSVQFSSVQFKMVCMRSTLSLRSFPSVALETVPMLV